MAKVSLTGFWTAKWSKQEGKNHFTSGKKISKACSVEVSFNKSTAELYADNAIADKVSVITKATFTITPEKVGVDEFYPLIGITSAEETIGNEETASSGYSVKGDEQGEYQALAYIQGDMADNKYEYIVNIFPKCIFEHPESRNGQTQGENITFSTESVAGTVYKDVKGRYYYTRTYTSEEDAIKAIKEILGVTDESVMTASTNETATPAE